MSPWIGPGPHDGDFDHQVVEAARLETRQHAHLGPALDLKDADGVGPADHLVHGGVLRAGSSASVSATAMMSGDQIEALADGREHAQSQDIDFQNAQRVEIVLVPLRRRCARPWRRFRWAPVRTAGPRVMTMPPTCCDKMPGKAESSAVPAR